MYNAYQKVLEVITVALVICQIIYVAIRYPKIGDRIPTHFDFAGNPNSWGNKSTIFILLGATVILYIMLTVCMFFPKTWNIPVKVTAENRARIFSYVINMLLLTKLLIVGCFFYMTVCSMEGIPLGIWFTVFMLVSILGVTFYYIAKMVINR
ncbi:MAG: DUF1648 domain-containing protein [Intestinibacter sp.]